jgi:hypothetical protein
LSVGGTVDFSVTHVTDPGVNGVYGTADDVAGKSSTRQVTDGSAADGDHVANGAIKTSWHVDLDAAGQGFAATNVASGQVATTTFTTQSPTPPPTAADVDLTASGNSGSVNDGVFIAAQIQGAGTGTFPAFVQISHTGTEQGYNTDHRPEQFNEGNSANHNHSLLLANVPLVEGDGTNGTVEGLLYREFLLDANEGNQ